MKAYDMSRHQRLIGTDGRISGTWVALSVKSGEVLIKPHEVTIYDETRSYGRVLWPDSLTAWVRDGEVHVPKHMIREETRFEVEEAWGELIELLGLIAQSFFDGPRTPESGSADSGTSGINGRCDRLCKLGQAHEPDCVNYFDPLADSGDGTHGE